MEDIKDTLSGWEEVVGGIELSYVRNKGTEVSKNGS